MAADTKKNPYETITESIIQALESGVVPWHRPWAVGGYHNAKTGRPYRGINVPILALAGFSDPRWLTFKQALEMGGSVRKGEHGTTVMFWKMLPKKHQDGAPEEAKDQLIPMIRLFTVFNVAQCDGLQLPTLAASTYEPVQEAEAILSAMQQRPIIRHGGTVAAYYPRADYIQLPQPETFESSASYYGVLFHELVHSTGHGSRLNRFQDDQPIPRFGSEDYSKEELIAELGAAFLRSACGLDSPAALGNSAAYIQSWLKALKDDRRLVLQAASAAQKAVDFIHPPQQETAEVAA